MNNCWNGWFGGNKSFRKPPNASKCIVCVGNSWPLLCVLYVAKCTGKRWSSACRRIFLQKSGYERTDGALVLDARLQVMSLLGKCWRTIWFYHLVLRAYTQNITKWLIHVCSCGLIRDMLYDASQQSLCKVVKLYTNKREASWGLQWFGCGLGW